MKDSLQQFTNRPFSAAAWPFTLLFQAAWNHDWAAAARHVRTCRMGESPTARRLGSCSRRKSAVVDRVALEFPELTIVGGHIGYPWTSEMIALATKYPRVYIDTSAYSVSRYPRELIDYLGNHGRKKVPVWLEPSLVARDRLSRRVRLAPARRPQQRPSSFMAMPRVYSHSTHESKETQA